MHPKKRRIDKKYTLRMHTKRRLRQRFKIDLNRREYQILVDSVGRGKCECIGRQSFRVTIHRTFICGQNVIIVYDNMRHEIITVLTEEQFREKINREGTVEK